MQRLTEEQRDLAGLPENVALAKRIAAIYAHRCPGEAEEIHGAAMIGLCDAASRFDAARGLQFSSYATARIRGEVVSFMRDAAMRGMGGARGAMRRGDKLTVQSLSLPLPESTGDGQPATYEEAIPAGELPVGWEIEGEDAIQVWSRRLPREYGAAIRAYYLDAETPTMREAGVRLGVSESLVSQRCKGAWAMLAEQMSERI